MHLGIFTVDLRHTSKTFTITRKLFKNILLFSSNASEIAMDHHRN